MSPNFLGDLLPIGNGRRDIDPRGNRAIIRCQHPLDATLLNLWEVYFFPVTFLISHTTGS